MGVGYPHATHSTFQSPSIILLVPYDHRAPAPRCHPSCRSSAARRLVRTIMSEKKQPRDRGGRGVIHSKLSSGYGHITLGHAAFHIRRLAVLQGPASRACARVDYSHARAFSFAETSTDCRHRSGVRGIIYDTRDTRVSTRICSCSLCSSHDRQRIRCGAVQSARLEGWNSARSVSIRPDCS